MDRKALTLLEIIISTVILALVITGLVNVFVAGRRFIQLNRIRISAAEIGKKFVDPLQAYVRQDTWDDAGQNCFASGNIAQCSNIPTTATVEGSSYTAAYSIDNTSTNAVRKVKVTVTLPTLP